MRSAVRPPIHRSVGFMIALSTAVSWAIIGLIGYLAYVCLTDPTTVGHWAGSIVHGFHKAAQP
jgi:hypothetical protein